MPGPSTAQPIIPPLSLSHTPPASSAHACNPFLSLRASHMAAQGARKQTGKPTSGHIAFDHIAVCTPWRVLNANPPWPQPQCLVPFPVIAEPPMLHFAFYCSPKREGPFPSRLCVVVHAVPSLWKLSPTSLPGKVLLSFALKLFWTLPGRENSPLSEALRPLIHASSHDAPSSSHPCRISPSTPLASCTSLLCS